MRDDFNYYKSKIKLKPIQSEWQMQLALTISCISKFVLSGMEILKLSFI